MLVSYQQQNVGGGALLFYSARYVGLCMQSGYD